MERGREGWRKGRGRSEGGGGGVRGRGKSEGEGGGVRGEGVREGWREEGRDGEREGWRKGRGRSEGGGGGVRWEGVREGWQASKLMPARMPGAAKIFAGPVNSSYWLPAQHSKLEPAGNYHTNGDLG